MNVPKTGRLLLALAPIALLGMPAAHAAGATRIVKPVLTLAPTKAAVPAAVVVKLGDAMLEEYHSGNPADRTIVLRGGEVAQKANSADQGNKHS